jgi:hypothetical protein
MLATASNDTAEVRRRRRLALAAAFSAVAGLAACGGGSDTEAATASADAVDERARAMAVIWTRIAGEGQSFTVSGVQSARTRSSARTRRSERRSSAS